jgi:hypothetical protein
MISKRWRRPALLGLGAATAAAGLVGALQLTGSAPVRGAAAQAQPRHAAPVRPAARAPRTRPPAARAGVGDFAAPIGSGSSGDDGGWVSVGIFGSYQECLDYFLQNYGDRLGEIESWDCEEQPNGSFVLKIKWYPRTPDPAPPTELPAPDPVLPPVPNPGCGIVPVPGIGPAPLPCLPWGS